MSRFAAKSDKLSLVLFLLFSTVVTSVFAYMAMVHSVKKAPKENIVSCQETLEHVEITITSYGFSPNSTSAKTCQELTFKNESGAYRKIAFGQHDKHIAYPSFKETLLAPEESVSFILTAKGDFEIHDHFQENIKGRLIVN